VEVEVGEAAAVEVEAVAAVAARLELPAAAVEDA